VEDFVEMAWQEGEPRAMACDTLSGLQYFVPEVKGKILGAWRLCKAWQRQELPTRALPLQEGMVRAMAMKRIRARNRRLAAAYLVAFCLCLRTGEVLGIRRQDIVLDPSGQTAIIHFGNTKSGKRRGETESVVLRNVVAVTLLALAIEGLMPGDRLIEETPAGFRSAFAEDIESLGLSSSAYKPYSLRRGGATHRFRSGESMNSIVEVGRWAHISTCRIYVNDAISEMTSISIPKNLRKRIDRSEAELLSLVGG